MGVELLGVVVFEEDDDGAGLVLLGLAGVLVAGDEGADGVAGVVDGAGGVVFGAGGNACHAVPPPPKT